MRNSILWDRDLADDDRMLVVRYEDLVSDPGGSCARVFDFLGVHSDERFVPDTTPTAVRDDPLPDVSDEIRTLCDAVQDRLDLAHADSVGRTPRADPVSARADPEQGDPVNPWLGHWGRRPSCDRGWTR